MQKTNTQNPSENKFTDKDKFIVIALVLVFLVIVVMVFQGNKIKSQEQEEANNNINTPQGDVKIELKADYIDNDAADYGFNTKIIYLQFAFLLNEMPDCYHGLVKTQKLIDNNFPTEALFEYASVMHSFLNTKLKPYLYLGSNPKFVTSISIAYKNGVINKKQCNFLHKLRKLRNKKAHQPGVEFTKEIATLYLNSGFKLIESTFIC